MPDDVSPLDRLAYTPSQVAEITNISRAVVYRQINAGKLKAKKLGARTYVLRTDLVDFLDNLDSI